MSLSSRSLRLSVIRLLCLVSGVCAAQQQFLNPPQVSATGGRVSSFLTGTFQNPPYLPNTDILYVNAAVGSGSSSSVTAGIMLDTNGQNFNNLTQNQITFTNVSNVVSALGDFNGDNLTDFAFAFVPQGTNSIKICIYYGTGVTAQSQLSSFAPFTGKSGCETIPSNNPNPPVVSYMVAFPLQTTSAVSQLVLEDSANNALYYVAENGVSSNGSGVLSGYTTAVGQITGGAGPMYVGDFDGDGLNDLIINGQSSHSASVYLSTAGLFMPKYTYTFDHNVHSMLVQDMDGDKIQDMVVEGDNGIIEIFKGTGKPAGPFQTVSEGGTVAPLDGFSGHGGHLAAINPVTRDILTTTPIGLSVLQGNGTLSYFLKNIYNIGPGRSSFALADFFGTGNPDFAVDSPEGVAIVRADTSGDGGFQTSNAYTTLAPALSATVGKFRNAKNNPKGNLDVAVNTETIQGQLLTGNGDGTFATYPGTLVPIGLTISPNVWSNILSGDFNGDGIPDIAYSLTGLPAASVISVLIQYGNGDGTFAGPAGINPILAGLPVNNNLFGESTVGDFNGDGIADIANIDANNNDTLLGQNTLSFKLGLNATAANIPFSQVAAGFFKVNRTNKQDLIFQQGASFIPYLNSGDGKTFTREPTINGASAPYYPAAVLLADVDGDGKGDLVVVYYNTAANPVGAGPVAPNQIYIWYGNGDGTFAATPQIVAPLRNYYLGAVTDMNGDGLPDLVLSDGSLIGILYNLGGRIFGGEQHYLAGQGINSISLADVNGDGEPDVVVANGGVTISNAIALGGATAASLSLTPNPDVNTGGITVLIDSITSKPVTGTLVATPEPSSFGAAFTLTATLFSSSGIPEPTGTVQFYIDGALVGPVGTLTQGASSSTASFTVPAGNAYPAGVHPISAIYSGDALNSPLTLTGALGTHAVTGSATRTDLFLCVGPTPACPSTGVISPPPPFNATLTMYYGQTWNGTTDAVALDGSALTGTIALNDSYTGPALPPTNPLCTLPISGGACPVAVGTTIGTSLGVNVLTATYSGDTGHLPSNSPSVTITVLQDTTTATLTGSPNPSPFGQPVTFTATLTGNFAPPTGPVSIFEVFPGTGTQTLLGTATLTAGPGNSSTATVTTSTLPVGTDSIQAVYTPTTNFGAAVSPIITETITPPIAGSFTLTVSPTAVSGGVGYATLVTVTVTPQNGFAQNVKLTCSNLPYEATCLFGNATITGGGGVSTLFVQTTAPHDCNATQPYFLGSNSGGSGVAPIALPALAGLVLLFIPGKRRWLRALLAVVIVAGATHLTGCGNCTDLGTRPNTYTITVTGTAADSGEIQAQPVTITVTI